MLLILLACTAGPRERHDTALSTMATDSEAGLYYVTVWLDPNPAVGAQTLIIEPTHAGEAVLGATVTAVPWMPAHDHGVSDASAVVEEEGSYTVSWTWPMAGLWEVTIDIDGEPGADSVVFAIDVE